MCELFAMSSREPSTVRYSLPEFAKHGAITRSNRSGWGIACFQDRDALVVKEAAPAGDSAWVSFIAGQDLQSDCVIAHVRLATIGEPMLENTHPFRRELGGRVHILAHNGTLKGIHEQIDPADLSHHPVGDTDSELAFCLLLERLKAVWSKPGQTPSWQDRFDVFSDVAAELTGYGTCNLLYSDGDALFVHAHKRIYEREEGRFGEPEPPGLSMRSGQLCGTDAGWSWDGLRVGVNCQETVMFASVPLDSDGWEPLPEATALIVRQGEELQRASSL